MRIAVSSDNDSGLGSSVSAHFGRCPFFTVIEVEDGKTISVESVSNPHFNSHTPGQVPAFVDSLMANVIISGGMGRRAVSLFQQFGIESVTGATGSVDRSVKLFLSGGLSGTAPCNTSVAHGCGDGETYEKDDVERLREEAEGLLNLAERTSKRLSTGEES